MGEIKQKSQVIKCLLFIIALHAILRDSSGFTFEYNVRNLALKKAI